MFRQGYLFCLATAFAVLVGGVAHAEGRADIARTLSTLDGDGAPRIGHAAGGDLSYLGAPAGGGFVTGNTGTAPEAARQFLEENGASFGIRHAGVGFELMRDTAGDGRTHVRFQQTMKGVPVFGGEAMVQVGKGNRIEGAAVDICRHLGAFEGGRQSLSPTLSADDAIERAHKLARDLVAGFDLGPAGAPELVIYAPEVIDEPGAPVLAWLLVIEAAEPGVFMERFLVNAHTGDIAFHYSLITEAKNRQIYDSSNTSADPGTLVRSEGGPAVALNDANLAYTYFGDTYDFYLSNHGRDSIDGSGLTLSATVRYCDPQDVCPFANAFWSGSRMYFGQGFSAADDVVGHELTHGVTQYTSNLIYANQSGALNESFSDVWGEFIDQVNGGGTDTAGVKWLLGEDVPGFGAIRNMKDPTQFGDPDRSCSTNFYDGPADNGGVHTNSGINNKLCFLLTDGGTFNGHTVTAMGIPTVADLYYEVQTNLFTSGSNYLDLYHALLQAAINIGLNGAQQANIEEACQAVEITDTTSCILPPPPPANDDCANAIAITLGQVYAGDLSGATGSAPRNCGGDNLLDNNDLWYTFSPPATGTYTVSLCSGPLTDTTLFVLAGTCGTNTTVACDDEGCGTAGLGVPSRIVTTLNQGTNYLVRVAGWNGAIGEFALKVSAGDSGGSESCADSTTGTLDNFAPRWNRRTDVTTGLGCNATSNDSSFDNMPYAAIPFHAETEGNLVAALDFLGTTLYDTTLYVYCDPFDPAQPQQNLIAFNDDYLFYLSGFDTSDGITLAPGSTYWLVVSTFEGASGSQLFDVGDFKLCLGEDFAFGPASPVSTPCALLTCPPFDAEGSGFYAYLATLLGSPVSYDADDIDSGGIPEHFEMALMEEVLCYDGLSWSGDALCTYQDNLETLAAETTYNTLEPYRDVLAGLLSTGPALRGTLTTVLGLTGTYTSAASGAKSGADALSPDGDPDQDGVTNLEEYQNVIADGGGETEYVTAALNPLLDGTAASVEALPVSGLAAAAMLLLLLVPAALYGLRRRARNA